MPVRSVRALAAKDLRALVRTRGLVAMLVLYPLLLAGLVAVATRDSGQRPRIAYVDLDGVPDEVRVGGVQIDYRALLDDVGRRAELVPMAPAAAASALDRGDVVAVVTVPERFIASLRTALRSPTVTVATRGGPVADRALREIEAFVYDLNGRLEREFLKQNVSYLRLLVSGGTTSFLGDEIDVLGLDRTEELVWQIDARSGDEATRADVDQILGFIRDARLALGIADASLATNVSPVTLDEQRVGGRAALLENRTLALVIAIGVLAVALVLGAVALAQERQEHVLPRLLRGPVGLGALVVEKTLVVALAGLVVGVLALGGFVLLGSLLDAPTGDALARGPLVALLLVPGALALAAVGVLAGALGREPAAGALVAILGAIPFVLIAVAATAGAGGFELVSAAFPFGPLVDAVAGVAYDGSPWPALGRGALHLGALALAYGGLARLAARRLAGEPG